MSRLARIVCLLVPLILAITGFQSKILADWWLENLATFLALAALAAAHKRIQLSDRSWLLIFLFLCTHEYGGTLQL